METTFYLNVWRYGHVEPDHQISQFDNEADCLADIVGWDDRQYVETLVVKGSQIEHRNLERLAEKAEDECIAAAHEDRREMALQSWRRV